MGGFTNSLLAEPTKQVFQVSLPAITSQAVSQWYNLPDTPLEFSAALTANGVTTGSWRMSWPRRGGCR